MKTSSGFEIEFDSKKLNNMEVIDAFRELQKYTDSDSDENTLEVAGLTDDLFVMIFGKKEKKRLYDHLRTSDGIVPPDAYYEELREIFNFINEDSLVKK